MENHVERQLPTATIARTYAGDDTDSGGVRWWVATERDPRS